jgi:hypothetical protein
VISLAEAEAGVRPLCRTVRRCLSTTRTRDEAAAAAAAAAFAATTATAPPTHPFSNSMNDARRRMVCVLLAQGSPPLECPFYLFPSLDGREKVQFCLCILHRLGAVSGELS